jgi:hypothetical protein
MTDKNESAGTDPHLGIPADANQDKHINFIQTEKDERTGGRDEDAKRKDQWQQGVEEGKAANENDTDNGRREGAGKEDTIGIP